MVILLHGEPEAGAADKLMRRQSDDDLLVSLGQRRVGRTLAPSSFSWSNSAPTPRTCLTMLRWPLPEAAMSGVEALLGHFSFGEHPLARGWSRSPARARSTIICGPPIHALSLHHTWARGGETNNPVRDPHPHPHPPTNTYTHAPSSNLGMS